MELGKGQGGGWGLREPLWAAVWGDLGDPASWPGHSALLLSQPLRLPVLQVHVPRGARRHEHPARQHQRLLRAHHRLHQRVCLRPLRRLQLRGQSGPRRADLLGGSVPTSCPSRKLREGRGPFLVGGVRSVCSLHHCPAGPAAGLRPPRPPCLLRKSAS